MLRVVECPQAKLHRGDEPAGYLAWHEWAERMTWTHRQSRCPGCGLFKIWTPRESAPEGQT